MLMYLADVFIKTSLKLHTYHPTVVRRAKHRLPYSKQPSTAAVKSLLTVVALLQQKPCSERFAHASGGEASQC